LKIEVGPNYALRVGPFYALSSIRGDCTPLELLLAGVRAWEGYLRRQFENSKSK
jgi:hypothetical protein